MRGFITFFSILSIACTCAAKCRADLSDYVFCAAQLNPNEEDTLLNTTGQDLFRRYLDKCIFDNVVMTKGPANCKNPACWFYDPGGPEGDDAFVKVFSFWGIKGLYFFISVIDREFVVVSQEKDQKTSDVLNIFLDTSSSDAIYSQSATAFHSDSDEVTNTMVQYLLVFNGEKPPDYFYKRSIDPQSNNLIDVKLTFLEAKALFGIIAEINEIQNYQREMQLFIPWSDFWHYDSLSQYIGKKIAFTISYSDLEGVIICELDWKNRCNPYCNPRANVWGDIELGPPLSEAIAGCDSNSAALPFKGPPFNNSTPTKMQRFSILGQRLRAENSPHKAGVLISRTIGKSGAAWAKKEMFTK